MYLAKPPTHQPSKQLKISTTSDRSPTLCTPLLPPHQAKGAAKSMTKPNNVKYEVDKDGNKVMKVEQSLGSRMMSALTGTPGEVLWVNEPFYQPGSRYEGLPRWAV